MNFCNYSALKGRFIKAQGSALGTIFAWLLFLFETYQPGSYTGYINVAPKGL